jgi:hypothetical protein
MFTTIRCIELDRRADCTCIEGKGGFHPPHSSNEVVEGSLMDPRGGSGQQVAAPSTLAIPLRSLAGVWGFHKPGTVQELG